VIESGRRIPGNQPVPLDANAPPALVLSGSAVVFAVDKETGARRPLFCVDPGEPLLPLPCPPEASWTVVAVPLESSGLELGRDTREWAAVVALENWLAKIGEAFGALRESGAVRLIHPPEKIVLRTGERAGIDQGLTFVRIGAGGGLLAGAPVGEGEAVALVPGLWLEAAGSVQGDGEWDALDDPPDNAREILAATVDRMVPVFIEALDQAERRREEADRRRFAGRREWDERVSDAAVKALTGVAWPARRQTDPERHGPGNPPADSLQDPVLEAMRVAAECLGVAVRPAQGPRQDSDQVREIADASGLRTRTVLLRGHWWRADNGPLVAFLEDGSPVALIPDRAGFFGRLRYWIFDPSTGARLPVGPKSAGKLQSFGRMLYRSFPDDLSARGLIQYALAGKRGDVRTIAIAGFGAAALSLAAPAGVAILIGQAIPDGDGGMVRQVAAGMVAAAFGSALFLLTQAVATMRVQIAGFTSLQTSGITC
jgi:ATP-binding cassette subfamily C protein